eukprot:g4322.t1
MGQCFCTDCRCALPCDDDVPCQVSLLGLTCFRSANADQKQAAPKLNAVQPVAQVMQRGAGGQNVMMVPVTGAGAQQWQAVQPAGGAAGGGVAGGGVAGGGGRGAAAGAAIAGVAAGGALMYAGQQGAFDGAGDAVVSGAEGLGGAVMSGAEGLGGAVMSGAEGLGGAVMSGAEGLGGAVMSGAEGLGGVAEGLGGAVMDGVSSLADMF